MRRESVSTTSRAEEIVCPMCEYGQLWPRRLLSRMYECDFCECTLENTIVGTLKQIVALPEALGTHACECGYPEMRRLPDGVFHCPACRSEVLPISIPKPTRGIVAARRRSLAALERIPGTSAGTPDEEGDRRMASGGR